MSGLARLLNLVCCVCCKGCGRCDFPLARACWGRQKLRRTSPIRRQVIFGCVACSDKWRCHDLPHFSGSPRRFSNGNLGLTRPVTFRKVGSVLFFACAICGFRVKSCIMVVIVFNRSLCKALKPKLWPVVVGLRRWWW